MGPVSRYLITASKALPGKFQLSYLPRTKVKHEYLTVVPEGFKFRRVVHGSLPALIKWFKEHFRDPIPGAGTNPLSSLPLIAWA